MKSHCCNTESDCAASPPPPPPQPPDASSECRVRARVDPCAVTRLDGATPQFETPAVTELAVRGRRTRATVHPRGDTARTIVRPQRPPATPEPTTLTTVRMAIGSRAPLLAGVMLCVLLVLSGAGVTVHAQPEVVENPDGSVSVRLDDRMTVIPADTAAALVAALGEYSGDDEALRAAVQAVVTTSAAVAGCGDEESAARCAAFMVALVVFVALESGADPATVAIVVEGVAAGAPTVEPQALLAALAALEDAEADPQSPTEEPRSMSPVQ